VSTVHHIEEVIASHISQHHQTKREEISLGHPPTRLFHQSESNNKFSTAPFVPLQGTGRIGVIIVEELHS
jgi:hypothetical protein